MKNKIIIFSFFWVGISIAGCSAPKMYYFGDYSKTLYALEKNQNEESLLNHKQELEKIISESEAKGLPIPPGIYAELGYICLNGNDTNEAIRLFNNELSLYPESKQLMDRLIQSARARENEESVNINAITSGNTASK